MSRWGWDQCSVCGKASRRSRSSRPEIICHACRPLGKQRNCQVCGAAFMVHRPSTIARTCSQSCRNRLRHQSTPERRQAFAAARQRRKRARKRQAISEPYTLAGIAERDGYRCGLCGKKVEMDLPYNSPRAATIDHVVPMSAGGDNIRANVQLAHRRCNTRKSNRGGGEQLRLVG